MKLVLTLALFALLAPATMSSGGSVLGEWTTPNGSVVNVYRCGSGVCAKVVHVSPKAQESVDTQNPNPSLRQRPLCGLEIGTGFHLTSPSQAQGGQLYDPESGNTYSGWMKADGNTLQLRGYVGISLFGRTETWTRAQSAPAPCQA
jgi:uncharacterized protein (DUF2147 family)